MEIDARSGKYGVEYYDWFLILVAVFKKNFLVACIASLGIILAAAYMLWLYRRVVFGRAEKGEVIRMPALTNREIGILVPLTIFILWFGVYPAPLLDILNPVISTISDTVSQNQLVVSSLQ